MNELKTRYAVERGVWPAIFVALAGYACGGALAWCAGFQMIVTHDTLGHCLEAEYLRDRLFESLLYLHAQPPVLNLILGLALKLEAAGGPILRDGLFYIHAVLGALAAAGVGALASQLIRPRVYRYMAILLFTFHPAFYAYTFTFFYTPHELVLLVWSAFFAVRFWRRRGTLDFAIAGLLAVTLVYTRTLFHPAWAIGFIALLFVGLGKDANKIALRRRVAVTVGLLVLLIAWPLKNWILFDTFSYTSWLGYNLIHNFIDNFPSLLSDPRGFYPMEQMDKLDKRYVMWTRGQAEATIAPRPEPLELEYWVGHPDVSTARPVRVRMLLDGKLAFDDSIASRGLQKHRIQLNPTVKEPRFVFTVEPPWQAPEERELGVALLAPRWVTTTGTVQTEFLIPSTVTYQVPPHLLNVPVIIDPVKPTRSYNHNHYWMFANARRGMEITVRALKRDPWLLLRRIRLNYLYFTRYTGCHPWEGCYYVNPGTLMERWLIFYQGLLCQDYRPWPLLREKTLRGFWPPSGFMFTFPLLVLLSGMKAFSQRRRRPLDARLAMLMLYSILWVFVIAVVIDGLESNRMRFPTVPLLIILFFWLLPAPRPRVEAPRQAVRRCQTTSIPR